MMRTILILVSMPMLAGCAGQALAELEVRPVTPPGYGVPAGEAYSLYDHGKRQLAAGNAGLAIDAFRRALRADPNSIDSLNGLGVAYDRIGRFDLSRRYYEQALGLDPNSAMVLHNLGYSLALQGREPEGRELMARAAAANDSVVAAKARQNLVELGSRQPSAAKGAAVTARAQQNIAELGGGSSSATTDAAASPMVRTVRRWIERTTAAVQTLVTDAGPDETANVQIEPRLRKVHVAEEDRIPRALSEGAALSTARAVAEMARIEDEAVTVASTVGLPARSLHVVNAVGRARMATRLGGYLERHGVEVAGLRNGATWNLARSEIRFDEGDRQAAVAIARLLPFEVSLRPLNESSAVQLILGRNALGFDDRLLQHRKA